MSMKITRTISSTAVGLVSGLEVTYNWSCNEGEENSTVYFSANTINSKGVNTSINGQVSNGSLHYNVDGGTVDASVIDAISAKGLELLSSTVTTKIIK